MNEDLKVISKSAYQWKMLFNPDPNKQAIDVCFLQKHKKVNYSFLFFMVIKLNWFQVKKFRFIFDTDHKISKCKM